MLGLSFLNGLSGESHTPKFFVNHMSNTTAVAGDDILLSCPVYSRRAPAHVTWAKDGVLIEYSERVHLQWDCPSKLKIRNASLEDSGIYSCTASQGWQAGATEAQVTVKCTPFALSTCSVFFAFPSLPFASLPLLWVFFAFM